MGNTFGQLFRITTFGESHGGGVGVVIDGCPPQLEISEAEIQQDLDRRRPGQSKITTPRKETDTCDKSGRVISETNIRPNIAEIKPTIEKYFMGNIDQTPPIFSAVKVNGKRAYQLARKNEKFEINSKRIKIFKFELSKFINKNKSQFLVNCIQHLEKGSYYPKNISFDLFNKKLFSVAIAT